MKIIKSSFAATLLTISILVVAPGAVLAQSIPNRFELEYTYSTPSEGEFEDEIEIHEGKAGVLFDVTDRKTDGVGFAIGAQFQADVWSPDSSAIDDLELYKVKIPLLMDFNLTDEFVLALGATPGIHSDFEDVDEDDWRVDGLAMVTYSTCPELAIMAGAAIGEEFGDVEGYPVGGVRWMPNDAWLLDLFFPRPRIQYALSDSFHLYAFGEPSGGEWNVGESERVQVDVQQKGYRAGLGVELGLAEKSWLYAAAGVESGREIQIAVDEEDVFDDEVELDDQAFFRVGFRVAR